LRPSASAALAGFLAAGFIAGCASLPPALPGSPAEALPAADAPFAIAGRISARRGDAGVAGAFTWTHDPAHDAIDLASPLGQTIAQLEGNAQEVTVRMADGRVESAPDWARLTGRAFGVTIPVEGLSAWVRGSPHAGTPFSIERDAGGRVALLRQDGWEIVYGYADDATVRPFRLSLGYPGNPPIDMRLVIDRRQ